MITPLTKLREFIEINKLDAVLISSVPNIIYLTNYSGFSKDEREAYLFIAKNKQYVLTDGRYAEAVKTLIPNFKLIEISSKLSFEKALKNLAKKHKIKRVGVDHHDITVSEHKKLSACFNDLNHFSLNNLRAIKNKKEILAVETACKLSDKAFAYVLKKIKLGVSEKEIANEIEFFIKKNGADISFSPIVAFGKNSAIPHHAPSNQKLKVDNIVLLDFGVKLNNYCSDMTRTVFFGSANAEFKKMYNAVLRTQDLTIQQFNNLAMKQLKIKASEIDRIAREYIISKGYKTIPHSLGHGIGIEVHEAPRLSPKSKDILKAGMVFSIEPGIYIPKFGSPRSTRVEAGGVRIEDLVVLEKSGPRHLTHSPKTLIEL